MARSCPQVVCFRDGSYQKRKEKLDTRSKCWISFPHRSRNFPRGLGSWLRRLCPLKQAFECKMQPATCNSRRYSTQNPKYRLFTVPYFSARTFSPTGRHLGLLMWEKLGRVQNACGRDDGVKSVGWGGGKNRETVTAFTALVAPATAAPDWCKGQ